MLTASQIAHREYLKSATWADIRQRILERDNFICQKCYKPATDVHHKHYGNWGNERDEDLISLCRTCHDNWHATPKSIRREGSIGTRAIWGYLTNSIKKEISLTFNLSEVEIYNRICVNCDTKVINYAASKLGYSRWYSQNQGYTSGKKRKDNPVTPIRRSKIKKAFNPKKYTIPVKDEDIRVIHFPEKVDDNFPF